MEHEKVLSSGFLHTKIEIIDGTNILGVLEVSDAGTGKPVNNFFGVIR